METNRREHAEFRLRQVRAALLVLLSLLLFLPWHTYHEVTIQGGLGPDNHMISDMAPGELHRGFTDSLALAIALPGSAAVQLAGERKWRHAPRWTQWLWASTHAVLMLGMLLVMHTTHHGCDRVEVYAAETVFKNLTLGFIGLGLVRAALRPKPRAANKPATNR